MKKYVLSLLMMICLLSSFNAQDTIPNQGFEDIYIYQNDTMPKHWTGFQSSFWAGLQNGDKFGQSTDESYSGNYALKLKRDTMHSYGGAYPGGAHLQGEEVWRMIKFTGRPKNFSFFYKYTSTTVLDTGLVIIGLFNVIDEKLAIRDTIAYTTQKLIATDEYTEFKFPLDYVSNDRPTHIYILFSTNQIYYGLQKTHKQSSFLWIDDLSFEGTVGTEEVEENTKHFEVIPNPVSSTFMIGNSDKYKYSGIKIYDRLGKLVLDFDKVYDTYDVSKLVSGIYFVEIQTEQGLMVEKLVKE